MLTHLLRALNEPLLIEPAVGAKLVSIFGRKLLGTKFNGSNLHAELDVEQREDRPSRQVARVMVIPVIGVIAQHPGSLGVGTDEVGVMVTRAASDPAIDGILLEIDSPGGTVSGVPELAAKIRAAAAQKPTLAIANSLAASAAYWIGAAAGEFWITPSGGAGSIGVWTAHEDWSKFLEQEGVVVTEMSAGEFKTEGAPWKPLTDEAKAFIQGQVNDIYTWFVKDVAMDRKATPAQVRAGYGEGRVLGAKQAKEANLVDRIGTIEEALAHLGKRAGTRRKSARASLERRLELDTV